MASTTLYPPNLSTTADAFVVDENYNGTCTVYYSLSKVSTLPSEAITGLHFTVYRQSTGVSAVRCKDTVDGDVSRYRQTGIVMVNQPPQPVPGYDNLYYFTISEDDINGDEYNPHSGWTPGYIYKIQMRLSSVNYTDTTIGQSAWLVENADKFSEWTTYCITKAINQPSIDIRTFKPYPDGFFGSDTLQFEGSYNYKDSNNSNELLYSYNVKLYDSNDLLIEDSDIVYFDRYSGSSVFNYTFKNKLIKNDKYTVALSYTTANKYEGTWSYSFTAIFDEDDTDVDIYTIDNGALHFNKDQNIYREEENGRIGIILSKEGGITGNYYIQRSSCLDDFNTWEDIALLDINITTDDTMVFYDYTIESGVWYKYAVQKVLGTTSVGYIRTPAKQIEEPIIREFEYSFLVGQDGQQLRLTFDGEVSSYKYTIAESSMDTIGGRYPIFSRNGNLKYRALPLTGTISYEMDEDKVFLSDEDLFGGTNNARLYNGRYVERSINYTKERLFREKVLSFLQDGKPKLFKSPTEGNILLRLKDVQTSPNKSLNRLISTFSANGIECGKADEDNYKKYKITPYHFDIDDNGIYPA